MLKQPRRAKGSGLPGRPTSGTFAPQEAPVDTFPQLYVLFTNTLLPPASLAFWVVALWLRWRYYHLQPRGTYARPTRNGDAGSGRDA
jgi:hypothetical protein